MRKRPSGSAADRSFEAWYAQSADEVTRAVISSVGDAVIGREATAEAMARAYERWTRVGAMESPEGWVHRTATNLCRRSWRRKNLERRALEKMPAVDTSAPLNDHAAMFDEIAVAGHGSSELDALVAELPTRMQTAVKLRYWDGLNEKDVATTMGVAPGTASALLSQARKRLRNELTERTENQS